MEGLESQIVTRHHRPDGGVHRGHCNDAVSRPSTDGIRRATDDADVADSLVDDYLKQTRLTEASGGLRHENSHGE